MREFLYKHGFDELDRAILEEFQENCRISTADLSRKIHLSQPAVHNRIKRLEKNGLIKKYTAILNRDEVGYEWMAFIQITLDKQSDAYTAEFQAAIIDRPQVLECHRLAGEYDMMLKVVFGKREELDTFIQRQLLSIPIVDRVTTSLVLYEMKSTTALSLR